LGLGKIRLQEAIEQTGSIKQAGRSLGMSYRRAWLLVDDMNNCFREPVIETQQGGADGGGTDLTPLGERLIERYRAMETDATAAASKNLHAIQAFVEGLSGIATSNFDQATVANHDRAALILTRDCGRAAGASGSSLRLAVNYWTADEDKILQKMRARGKSAAQVAKRRCARKACRTCSEGLCPARFTPVASEYVK
jgi:molybdate transport system regulatory protein